MLKSEMESVSSFRNAGFFLACEDFRRMFDHSFPTCAFFFFKVEISLYTLISLSTPGLVHSVLASWDVCGWVFPDELSVSSFLDRFPHYGWTAAQSAPSYSVRSRVSACLGITCHLHFWQNDQGLLGATAVARGWNRHGIRVSTESWLWWRKFPCCSCQDLNLQPFDHEPSTLATNYSSTQNFFFFFIVFFWEWIVYITQSLLFFF